MAGNVQFDIYKDDDNGKPATISSQTLTHRPKLQPVGSSRSPKSQIKSPPRVNSSRDMVNNLLEHLSKRGGSQTYVTKDEMANLGIETYSLDETTGVPKKGQQFCRLYDKADFVALDQQFRFSKHISMPTIEMTGLDGWHCGHFLSIHFENCLNGIEYNPKLQLGEAKPMDKSSWRMRDYEPCENLSYQNRYHVDNRWTTHFILEAKDSSKPHLIAFVGDFTELQESCLNFSELYVLVRLCAATHFKEKYKWHKIIPVTVICSSRLKVRIIQGYSDGKKGKIILNVGNVVHDTAKTRPILYPLLFRWLLSDPIGVTC